MNEITKQVLELCMWGIFTIGVLTVFKFIITSLYDFSKGYINPKQQVNKKEKFAQ